MRGGPVRDTDPFTPSQDSNIMPTFHGSRLGMGTGMGLQRGFSFLISFLLCDRLPQPQPVVLFLQYNAIQIIGVVSLGAIGIRV